MQIRIYQSGWFVELTITIVNHFSLSLRTTSWYWRNWNGKCLAYGPVHILTGRTEWDFDMTPKQYGFKYSFSGGN